MFGTYFSNMLNLVVDTCDCCSETHNFFGTIQALKEFIKDPKHTALFLEYQKNIYLNSRPLRIKTGLHIINFYL